MKLVGVQRKQLQLALLSAYYNWDRINELFFIDLDRSLDAVTAPGPMPTVITAVIQAASAEGWLEELVTKAWQKFPKNPELHSFVLEAALTPANVVAPASTLSRELEKAVLARVKFDNPAEFRERMSRSERAVCRIELPKPEWGTGFLVGPDTVMTNYHVIEDLEIGVQHRDQVVVRFDYELGADGRPLAGGTTCKLAADRWLLADSRNDDLDFALLRLDRPVGAEPAPDRPAEQRGWLRPSDYAFSGQDPEPLFILQHPQIEEGKETYPLKVTVGFVSGTPTTRRVTYTTNTLKGSSGSPCFRADWDLVALHHSSTEGAANEGIPFGAILGNLLGRNPPVRLGG